MIIIIENEYLQKLYEGKLSVGKAKFSEEVIKKFIKTIHMVSLSDNIRELRSLRGLNFEALKGDLKGKFSVRVDKKYRLILRKEKGEVIVEEVLIVEHLTNHYK